MARAHPPSWHLRPAALLVAVAAPVVAWIAPGCGTDAVGVEACRRVELTRCDVAPVCVGFEGAPAIETEEQVANCRTFYRDHCLLGLENTEEPPGQGDIDACVEAIRRTAACGAPDSSTAADCGLTLREGEDASQAPCAILQRPERLAACAWLEAAPEEGGGGATAASTADAGTTTGGDLPTTTTATGATTTTGTTTSTGGLDDGP